MELMFLKRLHVGYLIGLGRGWENSMLGLLVGCLF